MTALQLNAQLAPYIDLISEHEELKARLLNYVKRLAKSITSKAKDDSLMTKEEYFHKIDLSLQQVERGEVHEILPGEDLDDFLRRMGYEDI